jgi:carbonic anhydrase/acetyltransferase-like protein (isoleucine patch superfamily)
LGASVTVLKGVSIGYGSIIGARSVVTLDVPPMSIAVGNPARVVRRFDIETKTWVRAAEYVDAGVPDEIAYLTELRKQWPVIRGPRVASGHVHGDL